MLEVDVPAVPYIENFAFFVISNICEKYFGKTVDYKFVTFRSPSQVQHLIITNPAALAHNYFDHFGMDQSIVNTVRTLLYNMLFL